MEKKQVLNALDEFQEQVETVAGYPGVPEGAGAEHALSHGFDPQKFLSNLSIIIGGVAPFIPGQAGTILTAIDEVLSKLQVGGTSTPGGPVQIQ